MRRRRRVFERLFHSAAAGAVDGKTYTWLITDGNNIEIVRGAWSASGGSFARTQVLLSISGGTAGTALLDLDGNEICEIIVAAEDLDWLDFTEQSIASAATTDLSSSVNQSRVKITGTTTITSLGGGENLLRFVRFAGALTLTYNATSLILPGAANITTAAGDTAIFVSDPSGNWTCVNYSRASGLAVLPPTASAVGALPITGGTLTGALNWETADTIASASTVAIGAATSNYVIISGTTTITAFDTIAQGAVRWVCFSGALTLTNNSTSLILPGGANITTAAGDCAELISEGSGNWRCTNYSPANGRAVAPPSGMASLTATAQAFSGGLRVSSYSIATGSVTLDPGNGPLQYITAKTSAWAITAPSYDGSCILSVSIGTTGVVPTFSGFTVNTGNAGDAMAVPSSGTNHYMISILRINSVSTYIIKACQ